MKAKSTKMLALAVIAGLCVVAIIGAAYAAFAGTASTYNEGNNAVAGNILIDNDSFDPMINAANPEVFDTYSAETGVAYYFKAGATTVSTYTAKTVGSAKTIDVTNNTGAEITKLTFAAKATEDISNSEFVYFFGVTIGTTTVYTTAVSTTAGTATIVVPDQDLVAENVQGIADEGSVTVSLQLYIGYVADYGVPTSLIGDIVTPIPQSGYTPAKMSANGPVDLDDVGFGFTISDATGL